VQEQFIEFLIRLFEWIWSSPDGRQAMFVLFTVVLVAVIIESFLDDRIRRKKGFSLYMFVLIAILLAWVGFGYWNF
jgi:hypothetical protein